MLCQMRYIYHPIITPFISFDYYYISFYLIF